MAVAWGLSYPKDELGTVLPLHSADIPTMAATDWSDKFVSKEQV